jgi:hypothetical protein
MPIQNPIDLWSKAKNGIGTKKAVSETPVEERYLVDNATPFGVGISLTTLVCIGFHT